MEIMPPLGSIRRRLAIGVLFGFIALFAVVTVLRFVQWIRHEADFPGVLLAGWPALGVGLRQMWIASRESESRESEGPDERAGEAVARGVHK